MVKVAVAQVGSVLLDTAATLARIETTCVEAAGAGAQLIVLPEALLGGYPKGLDFGAVVGSRGDAGRAMFQRYFEAAVELDGPEVQRLTELASALSLHIVCGVIERAGHTLYCTGLLVTPTDGLVLRHRKLMPTGSERLLWGLGDGSTMQVVQTALGRIGTAICWENYMPLYRQHLYEQGVELWCAPTVDARPIWEVSMRHIAYEGRCFVLSACQWFTLEDWPSAMRSTLNEEQHTIRGRSLIVSPQGEVLAQAAEGQQLLFAELDLGAVARGKFDLDVAGHYNRRDIFELLVKGPNQD
jgi:nitrilase